MAKKSKMMDERGVPSVSPLGTAPCSTAKEEEMDDKQDRKFESQFKKKKNQKTESDNKLADTEEDKTSKDGHSNEEDDDSEDAGSMIDLMADHQEENKDDSEEEAPTQKPAQFVNGGPMFYKDEEEPSDAEEQEYHAKLFFGRGRVL